MRIAEYFRRTFVRIPRAAEFFVCALSLVIGAVVGALAARYFAGYPDLESIRAYTTKSGSENYLSALIRVARFPCFLAVCGSGIAGMFLIPASLCIKGFLTSYMVALLIRCYAGAGLLLGAALCAVQNILVLPCILIIAADGIAASKHIFAAVFKHPDNYALSGGLLVKSGVCAAVLFIAAALECWVTPLLFALAVRQTI